MIFLLFYQILSIALMPILIANFLYRVFRKKDKMRYFFERIGFQTGFSGNYIYIHAASVGESKSSIRLIKLLLERGFSVKITTMTITARGILEDIFADEKRVKIQQVPFDSLIFVLIFYLINRPKKIFIIESELWINLIKMGSLFSDIYYLNARLSEKSYDFWRFVGRWFNFNMFGCFGKIFTAESVLVDRLAVFNDDVRCSGNLKADYFPIYSHDGREFIRKFKMLEPKKTIFLANTHTDEELALVKDLELDFSKFRLIIAPRYISRVDEIVKKLGFQCRLFSEFATDNGFEDFECLMVDKMGVMSSVYDCCDLVFIGGSLLDALIGGHSPLEGVFHEKPVAIGSMHKNCLEVCNELFSFGAIKICNSANDFKSFVYTENLGNYVDGVELFLKSKKSASEEVLNAIL